MRVEDVMCLAAHYGLYVRYGWKKVTVKSRGFRDGWIAHVDGDTYEDLLDAMASAVSQAIDAIEARGK